MKRIYFIFTLLLAATLLQSCIYNTRNEEYFSNYTAVLMSRNELEQAVKIIPAENTLKAGKIYIADNLLFINDVNRGFHIYDYTDPANPVQIAFLNIPGATDIAVRDNTFYINQAIDLVTIQYNPTLNTIHVTGRNRNVFPQKISPDGYNAHNASSDKIVTDWTE